jgi:glycosyltransferase 2 family protein
MGLFRKDKLKFWLSMGIGLFFLVIAFWGQDFEAIGAALSSANYWWIFPALAAYFLGVGVRALRWHFLLSPIQKIPTRRLFPVVVIGYMANNVLPVRMGEIVRAYVLGRREGTRKTASLATIVVERIMDGITMLLFLVIVSFFVRLNSDLRWLEQLAGGVFLVAIIVFFAVAHSRSMMKRLESFGLRFIPAKLRPKVEGLADAFIDGLQVLKSWRDMLIIAGLSILAWVCEAGMYWLVALAFSNLGLSAAAIFMTLAVANLATLIPSTPGYVGPFDTAAKLVLVSVFGVAQGLALSYIIVLHMALLLPVTVLGFVYWIREHLSFSEASKLRDETIQEKAAQKLRPNLGNGYEVSAKTAEPESLHR